MKKACSVMLAAAMTAGMLAVPASAADFTDVTGHWGADSIAYVVEKGLFQGTSETTFSPDVTMNRGMFVTVLGRFAEKSGETVSKSDSTFSDVKSSDYFAPYVGWASANGIVTGVGDNRFNPNGTVTREQICTILVRYMNYRHLDLTGYQGTAAFADSAQISSYAAESVAMAQNLGLVQGSASASGTVFAPGNGATRAAVAAIFQRLDGKIGSLNVLETPPAGGGAAPAPTTPTVPEVPMGGGAVPVAPTGPSESEKKAEAEIAQYLKSVLDAYNTTSTKLFLSGKTDNTKEFMSILTDCLKDALNQRNNGKFLSKDYIMERYTTQIDQLKDLKNTMTGDEWSDVLSVAIRLESLDHLQTILSYFGVTGVM